MFFLFFVFCFVFFKALWLASGNSCVRLLGSLRIVFIYFLFYFIFLKSLLVACPTHTNPPGSGLGTRGIVFDKHIDKSTQQMNLKVHSYIFTMRLAVKHSISSS